MPGEGLSWRQAGAGAGLIPPKSLTFIPCSRRAAGFEQAGGSLLGRGSESDTAQALHPHKSLQPQVKTWEPQPGAADRLGQPWSSCTRAFHFPGCCNPKVVAQCSPSPLWGSVDRDFFLLPTTKPHTQQGISSWPSFSCFIKSLFQSRSTFLFVSNSTSLPQPCLCHTWLEPTPEIHFILVVCSESPPYPSRGRIPIPAGFWG